MRIPKRIKFLVFAVLIVFTAAALAETMVVKVQTTNLKKEPKFFADTIAVLKIGENVETIALNNGWYNVKTASGQIGWLHSSALMGKKTGFSVLSTSVSTKASGEEVALAAKGFNKQVEEKYQAENPNVNYNWVDRMLKIKVSFAELAAFLKKGKLGESGGAQ
ncbi:MAG: SH3 domain-containing protein [Candidatus Aminicenantes bacterium]|nr:SH3 domain-containing protein [Candidatus Aminicenantes bacterium]